MRKLSILLLSVVVPCLAWAQNRFIGSWEGPLQVNKSILRLVFHISEKQGKISAKMDSPDQGQMGMPSTSVTKKGDSIYIEFAQAGILYAGAMYEPTVITGQYSQSTFSFPLVLQKTDNPTKVVRSQTPVPPFNYKVEEVSYYNADKSIKFGGTLTIPNGTGPFPALLLITGSGQQNRDEEISSHKPFAVIADYLTRHGYAVLRVDDRGVNQTTGDARNATTLDFVKDAETSLKYLLSRKEADKEKTGLFGHSEGGLIATILASQRKDIDFIVLAAAPGIPIIDVMEEQTASLFESNGADSAFVAAYRSLYRSIVKAINESKDSNEARVKIENSIKEWKKDKSPQTIEDMGLISIKSVEEYVQAYVNIYNEKWFNNFYKMDPQPYIEKLSCKVLVLNGEKDIQVISKSNLQGFRETLKKSASKNYEVKELPGLNHLFQTCNVCIVSEYALLDETFSRMALTEIREWLDKNVKQAN